MLFIMTRNICNNSIDRYCTEEEDVLISLALTPITVVLDIISIPLIPIANIIYKILVKRRIIDG